MPEPLRLKQGAKGQIGLQLCGIDSTSLRASRSTAGGDRKEDPHEPEDHALGLSSGGIGTGTHVVAGGAGLPLAVRLIAGQHHE